MRGKEHQLQKQTSPPSVLTRDERYELIAQAAIKIEDCKKHREAEQSQIWNTNDIEISFDRIINLYE